MIVGCQQKSEPSPPHSATNANTQTSIEPMVAESTLVPKDSLADSITIDSVNEDQSIRAEHQTDKGTLLMISKGKEERGHLLVSSNWGLEGDQTFYSNYSVVYRQGEKDEILLELPSFLYIQPSDKKLPFEKVSFKDVDVYILTPQNRTGFGTEGFVFAIDKESGNAFPLKIIKNEKFSKALVYSEETFPTVENETLIVQPPVRAGTSEEDSKAVHYNLDLKNKQFAAN